MSFFKFLGTAGARFVVARQLRSSGGIYFSAHEERLIIDPGPGTLVKCAGSRPPIDVSRLTAILLTHAHIDHSNDVNILIDALTLGGLRKRGTLFAPRECLEGEKAVVLKYVKDFLEKIVVLESDHAYTLGTMTFSTSIRHQHSAETYGLKFHLAGRQVAFVADTKFFPGLLESYRGSDILVLNVVRDTPFEDNEIMHLTVDDAKTIIAAVRPRRAILTHFGMMMLKAEPWKLAGRLSRDLGIQVEAATDGLKIELGGDE